MASKNIKEDMVINGALTVNKSLTLASTVIASGSAPSLAAGAGAGTGPTVTLGANSSDLAGSISVTTGTIPTLSAVIVTLTYAAGAFPHGSIVILTAGNSATAGLNSTGMVFPTGSSTTFTITAGTVALAAATTYVWNYLVVGN